MDAVTGVFCICCRLSSNRVGGRSRRRSYSFTADFVQTHPQLMPYFVEIANITQEDFDEYCDPNDPKTIRYDDVKNAALTLEPYLVPTPIVPSHASKKYKTHIFYKPEIMQTTGSFKERGCLNVLLNLPTDLKKIGIVVASLGNEGIAMSYHCCKMGIPLVIVMPNTVPLSFQQRCEGPGIKVIFYSSTLLEAMKYARAVARDKGLTYINTRDHPDVLSGYATMALEIIRELPAIDAIMFPVGTGGLAAAIGSIVKREKPQVLTYAVQPEATPLFYQTLKTPEGETPIVINEPTLANSIAVNTLGVNSYSEVSTFIDKVLLVKEEWIAQAILHMYETQHWVVEGAAACPLAAIIGGLVPELKLKNVVIILTGGNVSPLLFSRGIERGLAAEGRLVKFTVMIRDNDSEYKQLLRLLAEGGYDIIGHEESHRWFEDDEYKAEITLACLSFNLEHAVDMKRMLEKAFPHVVTFLNSPFNDKRLCPCYVYKNISIT